jgi:GntR family transcriptional regulator, transcriptional repressor for pyruvate dehydrogenase complex
MMTTRDTGVTFEPVGAGRGFDRIVSNLRGMIVQGVLAEGQRLPSEPDLALQLGVSRPMLREALKALEVSGYLEVRRGYRGGRFVSGPEGDEFDAITSAPLSTMNVELCHLMDVRLAIEPMAARLAAQARNGAGLGGALRQLALSGARPARTVAALVEFHLALVEASANPVFAAIYESLRDPIALGLRERACDADWCIAASDRLSHVMRLVEDGEADAAERAVRRYLTEFEDTHERTAAGQW